MQVIAAVIRKRDRLCMQEQALQAKFSYAPIVFLVTVTFIARYRVLHRLQVHSNLMGSSGFRRTLQQAVFAESPRQLHASLC